MPPPSARGNNRPWILVGALAVVALAIGGAWYLGLIPGSRPAPSPSPSPRPSFAVGPPSATPLAAPPAQPSGDGTQATIETALGNVVFELFTDSAPVASQNFVNLAEAGYYNGVVFHRLVPEFMIQGGDPDGTGRGGPGYTIPDEPIVGDYVRGMVAMARTAAPNSQGSQFFIIVKDSPFLAEGGYTIFGEVLSGMEVVDELVEMPTANDDPGGRGGTALEPVAMDGVTIQRP